MGSSKQNDILRRLRILEGAMGIDLDSSSGCSGNPLRCTADPCTADRCPLRNNHVHRLREDALKGLECLALLQLLLQEMQQRAYLSAETIEQITAQVRERVLTKRIEEDEAVLQTIAQNPVLRELFQEGLTRRRAETQRIRGVPSAASD